MSHHARLSSQAFNEAAKSLATAKTTRWEWMESAGTADGYLLRRNEPWQREEGLSECTAELHVVYNPAFQVPCLLFNVFELDGSSLSLKDIMPRFEAGDLASSIENAAGPGSLLVQHEHPIVGRPFYMLHPCQTQDSMAMLTEQQEVGSSPGGSYLRTWLSLVSESPRLYQPGQSTFLLCSI
jgi:ubiquitin-like-conjugating enzyme ATG10